MAISRIKIVQGNDLPLCKKLTTIVDGNVIPVPVSDVTDLKVMFGMGQQNKAEEISWWASPDANSPIIHFRLESTQIAKLGTYNVWIVGKYGINDVVVSYGSAIEVIEWSAKSTAGEYIYTEEQALDDSIFIPAGVTDEELEELKSIYASRIVEAEQAREEAERERESYIEKAGELDNVAQESTVQSLSLAIETMQGGDESATISAIYSIVGAIKNGLTTEDKVWLLDKLSSIDLSAIISMLDNSTYGLSALKFAIEGIDIPTDYAKSAELTSMQSNIIASMPSVLGLATETNATSNKNAILSAISNIGKYLPADIATKSMLNALQAAVIGTDNRQTLTKIANAISQISFDKSDLAKEVQATDNKQAILAAIGGIDSGASMEEIQQALNALQLAIKGNNTSATITATLQVVNAIQSAQLTATDKQDILNAIQQVTPTIDFTEVLNAIAAVKSQTDKIGTPTSGDTLSSLLYQIKNNTTLTAAQAQADYQSATAVEPTITE